mmetsp:Transcript_13919/g.16909  ORF Transcript_13919/g.16909 Transcript_13919/m.16909 type:complete len:278 (-) Transcript_13919:2437-3270(-)
MIWSIREDDTIKEIFLSSFALLTVLSNSKDAIDFNSLPPKGENITISSIRLSTSGFIAIPNSSFTTWDISAYCVLASENSCRFPFKFPCKGMSSVTDSVAMSVTESLLGVIIFCHCLTIPVAKLLSMMPTLALFLAGGWSLGNKEESPSVSFRTDHNLFKKSAILGFCCPNRSKSAGDPPIAVCIALIKSASAAASIISDIAAGLFCSRDITSSGLSGSIEGDDMVMEDEAGVLVSVCLLTTSNIFLLPTLLVMTKIQFLKFTVRPFPSVKIPSSII